MAEDKNFEDVEAVEEKTDTGVAEAAFDRAAIEWLRSGFTSTVIARTSHALKEIEQRLPLLKQLLIKEMEQ